MSAGDHPQFAPCPHCGYCPTCGRAQTYTIRWNSQPLPLTWTVQWPQGGFYGGGTIPAANAVGADTWFMTNTAGAN